MCLSSQQFCVILLSSTLCSCPFTKKLIQELGCASISTELYYLQDLSSYQKVTSYANHISQSSLMIVISVGCNLTCLIKP